MFFKQDLWEPLVDIAVQEMSTGQRVVVITCAVVEDILLNECRKVPAVTASFSGAAMSSVRSVV